MCEFDTDAIIKKMEPVLNEILPGLTMYVRDADLPEKCAAAYVPGTIIKEPGFTDASCRVMGMKTTHRIAILSNHMADLQQFENGTNWGLHIAKSDSHFKVLDVYEKKGRIQILLLHLPDDYRWKLFENVAINLEEEFIETSRQRFENKAFGETVPELVTEEWLARCAAPIGMNEEGISFDLEPMIANHMHKVNETNFREYYQRYVFVECRDVIDEMMSEYALDDDTGVLAYGYVDEQCGLSFKPIEIGKLDGNSLHIRKLPEDIMFIVRAGRVMDNNCFDASLVMDTNQYDNIKSMVDENYRTTNELKEQMRNMAFLDAFRHPEYPDDVNVILYSEGFKPEQIWVRCCEFDDNMLFGEMLNEPEQDFGVHMGELAGFAPIENEDGIMLVAFLRESDEIN